ncbi:hypothetical protein Rleg4DRAFT_1799 [Rhizobium leguminosarum bv. trifolii WSM2297]|uniref:Uncharacterized protein n=1 Tax=Rhizobium leguminosarum bv. trifolii WSM2297 TaxID=754762 RepID=J0CKW8_RHILT|nr:hypothetical protein [Rhizobium leguminosarum]EJC80185.1 hypothetical protein Rleg4DRAFT_1799 [Rhizobium leguminosarum bv. trifolii WSM2297]
MLLVADGMMNMLGAVPNATKAAEAFLGIKVPADASGFLVNMASNPWEGADAFLSSIAIDGTHFNRTVRRAYDLLTELKPIHEIQHQDERDESLDWIGYFGRVRHHASNAIRVRSETEAADYVRRGYALRMRGKDTNKVNLITAENIVF